LSVKGLNLEPKGKQIQSIAGMFMIRATGDAIKILNQIF
jgi:hypothetical protein